MTSRRAHELTDSGLSEWPAEQRQSVETGMRMTARTRWARLGWVGVGIHIQRVPNRVSNATTFSGEVCTAAKRSAKNSPFQSKNGENITCSITPTTMDATAVYT